VTLLQFTLKIYCGRYKVKEPLHSACSSRIVSNKKGGANLEKIDVEINFN